MTDFFSPNDLSLKFKYYLFFKVEFEEGIYQEEPWTIYPFKKDPQEVSIPLLKGESVKTMLLKSQRSLEQILWQSEDFWGTEEIESFSKNVIEGKTRPISKVINKRDYFPELKDLTFNYLNFKTTKFLKLLAYHSLFGGGFKIEKHKYFFSKVLGCLEREINETNQLEFVMLIMCLNIRFMNSNTAYGVQGPFPIFSENIKKMLHKTEVEKLKTKMWESIKDVTSDIYWILLLTGTLVRGGVYPSELLDMSDEMLDLYSECQLIWFACVQKLTKYILQPT